jgi:hypothetical protein
MFSIRADFDRAERMLSDIGRKQLPFASAMALNDTAGDVKGAEEQSIGRTFDRPTPFTQRGVYVRRASKSRLYAEVGVKRVQAGYLRRQVTGGVRTPEGAALLVPVSARLNKYGNLPKTALKRARSRTDVFVASRSAEETRHLPPGVYQRGRKRRGKQGGPKLLVAFEDRASYTPRWNFQDLAMRRARDRFRRHFLARFRQAMASAR